MLPLRRTAFTLVELLTVIIIIGLLAAILLPTVTSALKTGYTAQTRTRVESLARGCDLYKREFGLYPGQADMSQFSTYTGSQILGVCMYGYTYGDINANPKTAKPRGIFDTYKDEFLPADGKQTPSTVLKPYYLSDGFPPGKCYAICYYPSVPGTDPQNPPTHYLYTHNQAHTDFKPVNAHADATAQKNYFEGTVIKDPRFASSNRVYRADEFVLIAPGADRKYFTSDDIRNF